MKKIIGFVVGGLSLLILTAPAFAQKINLEEPTGSIKDVALEKVPQFIITLLFVLGIVISIAFLIWGGIKWILSGGDKAAVESARNHIIAAIIGLVIVVGAFFILNIVFTLLTGQPFSLGNLCIPSLAQPKC